jgi:tetratricopeptide (TPR) repeat protein
MTRDVLLAQAGRHWDAGRLHEAIAAYRQALAIDPNLPNSWYNLAQLQRSTRSFHEALASYGEALARGVRQPEEVHLNRGVIFADDLGDGDAAEAELQAALAIAPAYVPAWLNLGNLYEDLGLREKARAAYEKALGFAPDEPTALARLAGVSPLSGAGDPLLARLRGRLAQSGTAPEDRATLAFALAAALDSVAAYDEAFAAYAEANAASKAASGARYDRAAHEAFVDRLIAAFPEPAIPAAEPVGQAPIFICGMFRSGSTLTEHILARHPAVSAGGELDILPFLIANTLLPYPEAAAALSPERTAQLRALYLAEAGKVRSSGQMLTDKRPDNFLHIGLIKRLFPEARIVHTRRNALDNGLSLFFLHLDPAMAYALDLADIAHWYGQYRRLMRHWQRLYPHDLYDADYDALVADPEPEIRALLRFCGLEWDPACLSFSQGRRMVRTASAGQVSRPLYRSSSGRWRNYEGHLQGLRRDLGDA